MELNTFITDTLTQIAEGARDAQKAFKDMGCRVNPSDFETVGGNIPYGKDAALRSKINMLCNVQFEVALTSGSTSGGKGGVNVLFGAVTVGGNLSGEESETSLTRVKFNIPISLPSQ